MPGSDDNWIRKNQKNFVYIFFAATLVILIGFLVLVYFSKFDVWIGYIWIPLVSLELAFIGVVIENNRLECELSLK